MWSKLHIPWRSSRRTPSPTNGIIPMTDAAFVMPNEFEALIGPQRIGDRESVVSPPEGVSTVEGAGLSDSQHIVPEPPRIGIRQGAISSVRFLPDGKHIVIGGNDGVVRRWKVEEGSDHAHEVGRPVHSEGRTNAAAVSKDGRWIILVGTEGRRVAVWDTMTYEKVVESTEAHEQKITTLDVSSDTSKIASGSQDGTVIVWCLETGHRLAGPFKQGRSVMSVRFSPTGDRLASAGWDYLIYVWNICSDGDQSVTHILADPTYSLAWSRDGCRLFAGCHRGSILRFDVSSSTPTMSKWPGHPHVDSIPTLCLSNNGKFIISASGSECSVKIWDVHARSEIGSFGHTGEVIDADISPDDGLLVTATKDGQVFIWNLRKVLPTSYFFHSLTACLTFPSRSDSYRVLMDVSNAAYVSWTQAELVRAEELLSSEIGRKSRPLHYHLANRALVRTRLRQWDGALDDAQTSFRFKPSLVARLAKSVAQSGQEPYNAAIETLNDALENCDQEEKDFVNVMKAITFFDVGLRTDAIRHVNDLVVRSPDAKHPCAFVQAKMYALLAADAMESREYVRAIRLFAQARDLCPAGQYPEMNTISLISGWVFDGLKLTIYRGLCEACYAAERTQEVLDNIRETESSFRDEIKLRSELSGWFTDLKCRCVKMLESQGDGAMDSKNYDHAIAQYTAAFAMNPAPSLAATLFVKCSEARAMLCLWEDALKDADEAIKLNPSSPWGYERKHAALHKLERCEEAIDALKTMILNLENSPDPGIRDLRRNYINPSDTEKAILEVFMGFVQKSPFRLIDTTSGQLCDAEERGKIFKEDPIFQELVSSMTTKLDRERIDTVTRQYFQYVMLSHRWEAKELELADVLDKSIYALDASSAGTKLQRFCRLARDAKFRWAWSDTCCINKDKDVEFERSINTMFDWYRCSAATIVYLAGVPPRLIPGALKESVWMTRGWTLQELLAPPIIRFYYEDWTPYLRNISLNHKESTDIMQELEEATGVTTHDLLAFRPGTENIRVKLRLASTRDTTVPVDMAYGLFGIFGLTMPVIHGESQQHALGRLFQEIVAQSGDIACLSWAGRSSEFNSTFPDHIQVYQHASRTIPNIAEEDMERQVVELRRAWTREEEVQAMAFYQKLDILPPARCTNQHLHLPCIVFPLTTLKKVKQTDRVRVYRAMTTALEDTDVHTEERLLPRSQVPGDLVLVCPWIDELLDATPLRRGRHRRPSVDAESPSDSDSEPESEPERDTFARGPTFNSRSPSTASVSLPGSRSRSRHDTSAQEPTFDSRSASTTSVSLPGSDIPLCHSPARIDTTLQVLRLVVRLRQPLGALLLLAQGHGQYRRVATDHDIIIRVRNNVSLDDMILNTLEIL